MTKTKFIKAADLAKMLGYRTLSMGSYGVFVSEPITEPDCLFCTNATMVECSDGSEFNTKECKKNFTFRPYEE